MLVERRFIDVRSPRISLDLPLEFANRRVELIVLALDQAESPEPSERMTETEGKALLATTAGAWGKHPPSEVEAIIEKHRLEDWGDD
jgi:hypothetical protein